MDQRSMLRCSLVTAALVVTSLVGCAPNDGLPAGPHPLIIVDVDTLRADHLGCYGYHRDTSPNIDAFAAQSVFFEHAYSQAPNTPPSQATILSGLYPSTHGMVFDEDRIPDEVVMLAEALSAHGLITAGFHDGGYLRDVFGFGQGFGVYEDGKGGGLETIGPKALQWLREHSREDFMLFIHTYDTHTPYAPRAPYDTLFMEGVPEPTPGFEPTTDRMEEIRLSKYTDTLLTLPDNDLAYAMALYDGEIRAVDTWFGDFWSTIEALGLDRRATVVFISDHGEEFQEHGSVLHEKLYATVTHVPFMIRLPHGRLARRVSEVVEAVDLMPTLLELQDAPIPAGIKGSSLVPLMLGQRSEEPWRAISESPFFGHRRAVVLGDHHLLYTKRDSTVELYDLRIDPLEQRNLADEAPNVVTALKSLLDSWEVMVGRQQINSPEVVTPLDDETLEQLRQLGYIQ